MLGNGINRGEITEIIGYSSSGKTQFCYTIASNVVTKYNDEVLYIDTDLSFSRDRMTNIFKYRFPRLFKSSSDLRETMNKIKVIRVLDINSLINILERIAHDLETNSRNEFNKIGVIIIDSLTTPLSLAVKKLNLLASEEKDKKKEISLRCEALSLISQMANTLHTLASKHSIAIIVANSQSVTLKQNWKNFCAISLLIEKIEKHLKSSIRNIKITQTNRLVNHNSYCDKFEICDEGLKIYDSNQSD
jgi:RAD51-like protein 3